MIVSAISLWKKYQCDTPLNTHEWGQEDRGDRVYTHLHYSGHTVGDGSVRIYARFGKPKGQGKFARFITFIFGDYNNVVGLPVGRLYQELKRTGLEL